MVAISTSIICWLVVGHGVFNNTGPPLLGSQGVFVSGLHPSKAPAALKQAVILTLVANIALGAVSEGITLRATLLLTAIITCIVVPVSARTIWHYDGVVDAVVVRQNAHRSAVALLCSSSPCHCRHFHSWRKYMDLHCQWSRSGRCRGRRHHTLYRWCHCIGIVPGCQSRRPKVLEPGDCRP